MLKKVLVLFAGAVSCLVLDRSAGAAAVAPATAGAGDYCVVHVTGQKSSGELTTGAPRCYGTFAQSMAAEGVSAWGSGASRRAAATRSDFVIGLHCDGYNLAAPCTSVVGADCSGGWLNVSAAWNNRISSTQNGCPLISHFDGANRTGSSYSTFGAGSVNNLVSFNNRTTSIQYN